MDIYNELTAIDWAENEQDCGDLIRYETLPSYETFVRECFIPNRVALFTEKCGLTKDWPCQNEWLNDDRTKPNFERLIQRFGHMTVPVTKCSSDTDYHSDANKLSMTFEQFVNYWRDEEKTSEYYCKDWHLQKSIQDNSEELFYETPIYFQSDWLNEMCLANNQDDFRFVYMGGSGTFTPHHMDVLGSYSWSANICGEKLWRFTTPKTFEFVQKTGEVLFVPSQWYHQVTNIGHTISINHNWFNAFNIRLIWKHLCSILTDIEIRIDDCRALLADSWHQQCQQMLKANEGLDLADLYKLLHRVAQSRFQKIDDPFVKFDLWTIEQVLKEFVKHSAFLHAFDFDTLPQRPKSFIKQIHSCIYRE